MQRMRVGGGEQAGRFQALAEVGLARRAWALGLEELKGSSFVNMLSSSEFKICWHLRSGWQCMLFCWGRWLI